MTSEELLRLINAGFTKSDLANLGFDFPAPASAPASAQASAPAPASAPSSASAPEPGNGKTWDDVYNAITGLVSTIQAGNIVSEGVANQPKKDEFWGLDKIINPMNGQEV